MPADHPAQYHQFVSELKEALAKHSSAPPPVMVRIVGYLLGVGVGAAMLCMSKVECQSIIAGLMSEWKDEAP